MTLLKNYHHFDGRGWTTGYVHNALAYQGVTAPHTGAPYSEALLMGINGGIAAGYFAFEYTGHDPHLSFLTLYPFDEEPGALFERLALPMNVQRTPNPEKAAANVINDLARGCPVVVWADGVTLDYNALHGERKVMWLIMPLLVHGCDLNAGMVHIADRAGVPLTARADEFAAARARVGKTRHRQMTIGAPDAGKLPAAVRAGMNACLRGFNENLGLGSKKNWGFDAYQKWASLLSDGRRKESWAQQFAPGRRMVAGLTSTYRFFRGFSNLRGSRDVYADFLGEAAVILEKPALHDAAQAFRESAALWSAFTAALLPDDVPAFRDMRLLLDEDGTLFVTRGGAAAEERLALAARFKALSEETAARFPLSEAQAAEMRAGLRDHVLRIHDHEREALALLDAALG